MTANGTASRGSTAGRRAAHQPQTGASRDSVQRLSCEECQKRKSKCDKQEPCSMCRQRGIVCTPAFLDPHKPRKKRFPERELLDRIRRYEDLLTTVGIDKDQSAYDVPDISSASSSRSGGASRPSKRSRLSSADSTASVDAQPTTLSTHRPGLSAKDVPPTPPHTATIDSDIGDLESILESVPLLHGRASRTPQSSESGPPSSHTLSAAPVFSDAFTPPSGHAHYAPISEVAVSSTLVIHKHLDLMFPDDGSKYFNLDDHCPGKPLRHPDASLMFRLLHIYEQNVHPLIKVVHMPSVRERFCDISADPSSANAHGDALMFAIYAIAVSTITAAECGRLFGNTARKVVWEEYRRSTQTALCRVELWRSSHIGAIQAYLLYLLTLTKDVDPRAFGICSGNVGRMVQRLLSLHNKRTSLWSAPIKAVNQEMGIQLWWEILACDMRACEKSGIASNPTLATATTTLPRNASDTDLEQVARSAMHLSDAVLDIPNTECLFLLLRCEIAQFQLHPPWSQQHPEHHLRSHLFRSTTDYRRLWESGGRRPDTSSLSWRLAAVDAFDTYIAKRYFERPETATSTLVQYAHHHACMWIKKIRLFVHLNQRSVENDAEVIRICTVQVQETAKLLGSDRFVRFQWYTYQQLPFFSFVILLDLLRRHTTGKLVDQAWTAIASSSVIWRPDIANITLSEDKDTTSGAASNASTSSSATPSTGTTNIYADWADKQDRNKLQVRGTMLAALMVAAWEKRAQALAAASEAKSACVTEEPAIVAAMRTAAAVIFQPAPGADGAPAQSQGCWGVVDSDGDQRPPHHVAGGSGSSAPQMDGHGPAGAVMDPTAFTAFLDPSSGSSASALDDMLNLNSLLQSSVDLDWSSWFNPTWAPTPASLGQMSSPANFLPPL
ncbi:uncharacterized protein SRS1_12128 [Sporisorium reilianum f. sp. reilianum]|uniref:Zn(2)-C6 fungal-type domain-containing protein n=1 Tax=Sporisorium reilianum f. sp. reilianum TaxID=72559 RepID=A0A2N8U869_9BASI|nr:uncharacterized protein SRS1_12128 [Sporisorium reilianum f. sp. reilianum]